MKFKNILQPKNDDFFHWFELAAENNFLATKELQKLCKDFKDPKKSSEKIHRLEHIGDEISHKIYDELHKSFITPMDREDIAGLTSPIDDVIDLIYLSASNIDLYNVKKTNITIIKLSDIIVDATEIIKDVLPGLRKRRTFSTISKAIIAINQLENQADELFKSGIRSLFKNQKNPIDIMRWQNIYTSMEDVVDRCEDIADILRGLVIKYV